MLYHHSYYGVSPLPLPNVISFTTTISTTSASLYHSCILDHCFFGLPLFVWTTTTLWIATIFLDYRCIYVSNKAVCDPNFRFFNFEMRAPFFPRWYWPCGASKPPTMRRLNGPTERRTDGQTRLKRCFVAPEYCAMEIMNVQTDAMD